MAPDNQHLIPGGIPGDLRGAKGRVVTGGGIIVLSALNLVLAVVIVASYSSTQQYAGLGIGYLEMFVGIGFLVLSIIAGSFGIFSRRSSCRVITYLVLCVVLAIFTGYWGLTSATLTYTLGAARRIEQSYYLYGHDSQLDALHAILLVSTLISILHCFFSIAGASFTCGAVCCVPDARDTEQPMFVLPSPGAMQVQQPQPDMNAYSVDMGNAMPVNGNPPPYGYPFPLKTTA